MYSITDGMLVREQGLCLRLGEQLGLCQEHGAAQRWWRSQPPTIAATVTTACGSSPTFGTQLVPRRLQARVDDVVPVVCAVLPRQPELRLQGTYHGVRPVLSLRLPRRVRLHLAQEPRVGAGQQHRRLLLSKRRQRPVRCQGGQAVRARQECDRQNRGHVRRQRLWRLLHGERAAVGLPRRPRVLDGCAPLWKRRRHLRPALLAARRGADFASAAARRRPVYPALGRLHRRRRLLPRRLLCQGSDVPSVPLGLPSSVRESMDRRRALGLPWRPPIATACGGRPTFGTPLTNATDHTSARPMLHVV